MMSVTCSWKLMAILVLMIRSSTSTISVPIAPTAMEWAQLTASGCDDLTGMTKKLRQTKAKSVQSPPKWCMIFYHIPKTAGTTLKNFWAHNKIPVQGYGIEWWRTETNMDLQFMTRLKIDTMRQLELIEAGLDPIEESRTRVLQGHFGYGMKPLADHVAKHVSTKEQRLNSTYAQCFEGTMLRDPVDRVLSAYYFHGQYKKRDHTSPGEWKRCLSMNFVKLMLRKVDFNTNHDALCFEYGDDQVKFMSGKFTLRSRRVVHNGKTTFGTDGHPSLHDLNLAKRNLCKMDFVLLLENMTQSQVQLANSLSLNESRVASHIWTEKKSGDKVDKKILKPDRANMPSAILEIIEHYNSLDIELYKFAQTIFKARQYASYLVFGQ